MPRNKPRLQLALYARPKHPGTYHYALLVAPKRAPDQTPTTKHHAKNTWTTVAGQAAQPWRYERTIIAHVEDEQRLLARLIIAKVTAPRERIDQILEGVPVYQMDDSDEGKAKSFTCRSWVQDALQLLAEREAISGFTSWDQIQRLSVEYVETKKRQRRWSSSWAGSSGVPLMDALNKVELIP